MANERFTSAGHWHGLVLSLAAGFILLAATAPAQNTNSAPATFDVGLDEKIGQFLPGDAAFYDEHGVRHTLQELIDRPTIVALVFFHCPGVCSMIQGNLAETLKSVPDKLGKAYQVLTISFDDAEGPDLALEAKGNYMRILGGHPPDTAWRFLTGDFETIRRVTQAVGFKFIKNDVHNYTHPNLITVVAPDRKIIRYLYGTDYLPVELTMALSEAARGTPGVSIKKIVSYCFAYDAQNKRYIFRLIRVAGVSVLVVVGIFLFFLLRKGGNKRSDGASQEHRHG
jgi:protein SCO1